ncbi:MAG: hypothetical protein NXI24_21375 [bacterium]|nr:hypothetical protein [bacterium]
MTETKARRTKPGIHVDAADRWWFGPNQIVNPDVLKYFKANLRRDREGEEYYIVNRFGELLEHASLDRVSGFPLIVETVLVSTGTNAGGETIPTLDLRLDSRQNISVPADGLTVYDEHTLGILLPERLVPARLGPLAMASLADFLDISEGDGENESPAEAEYRLMIPAGDAETSSENQSWLDIKHGERDQLFAEASASDD